MPKELTDNEKFLANLADELETEKALNVKLQGDLDKANERIATLEKEAAQVPKKGGPVTAEWPAGKVKTVPATPEHSLHAAELQRQALAKR